MATAFRAGRGGLMHHAQAHGLHKVAEALSALARRDCRSPLHPLLQAAARGKLPLTARPARPRGGHFVSAGRAGLRKRPRFS